MSNKKSLESKNKAAKKTSKSSNSKTDTREITKEVPADASKDTKLNEPGISTSKTIPVFYDKNASIVIEKDDIGSNFYLGAEQSHHITVLRQQKGDLIDVVDGRGKRIRSKILNITKNRVDLKVEDVFTEKRPYPRIGIVVPIIKEDRFERILEVAAEMKVSYVVPWQANRSESKKLKKSPAQLKKLNERWTNKIIASVNQSRSSLIPTVKEIIDSNSLQDRIKDLTLSKSSKVFLLHENGKETFSDVLRKTKGTKKFPKRISIIVGPEGSFDEKELEGFTKAGATPIKLVDSILRVGTAISAAISYIRVSLFSEGEGESAEK